MTQQGSVRARAGREKGVRVVDVPDVASALEAARGCGRYPRVRFVLCIDNAELPLRGSAAGDLLAGLSRGKQRGVESLRAVRPCPSGPAPV